jgi:FtsZ-binding cell division protein ZapB
MFTSMAASLHYKSTFKLVAYPESDYGWTDIVKQIRWWISSRNPDERFGKRWFFTGTELKFDSNPGLFVKTLQALGDGDENRPQFWTVRYERPDANIPFRRWRTDVGVTCLGPDEYQISVATSHALQPGYIGEEPPTPIPSAPFIVRMLLENPRARAFAGSELLTVDPVLLHEGGGSTFIERLKDPNRQCPIILVTRENKTGSLKVSPEELSKMLVGTAQVYYAENTGVNEELPYVIPHKYLCKDGMVRVYQPRLRFDSERDYRRHRFFIPEQIDQLTPEKVIDALVRGIARGTQMLNRAGVTSIEDVFAKRNAQRLEELRAKYADEPELNEYVEKFDEVNRELNAEIARLKEEGDELWQEMEQVVGDKETLEREAAELRHEVNTLRDNNRAISTQAAAIRELRQLPSSILEATQLVERLHPDKIVFTERALAASQKTSFSDIGTAWSCLWSVATTLHALYFDPTQQVANIPEEFKNLTGFELALTETSTTQNDRELMKLRELDYKGRKVDITPHIKYGNKPPKCFRVYFHAHQGERRIIVGHCGDHLPTSGTRRL